MKYDPVKNEFIVDMEEAESLYYMFFNTLKNNALTASTRRWMNVNLTRFHHIMIKKKKATGKIEVENG